MISTANRIAKVSGIFPAAFFIFFGQSADAQSSGGTFQAGPAMMRGKIFPTASLLDNGKVITFSGREFNFVSSMYSDLYNPENNTFSETQMNYPHDASATVKLSDGRYMMLGGGENLGIAPGYATTEIYDPASGTFSAKAQMTTPRMQVAAVQLGNGKILVAGAWYNSAGAANGELYNPETNSFAQTGPLSEPRSQANIFPTTDSGAVVFGGWPTFGGAVKKTVEYYSPASNAFSGISPELIPSDPGWIPASITTRPFADCKLKNGQYLFMAYRDNGNREYALIRFNPESKQFSRIVTDSPLTDSFTDGGFADFVLNKNEDLAYLVGFDNGFDPQRAALATVNLNTGAVTHPGNTFTLPPQEYFYSSYTYMPASGKILVLGINGSNSGYFSGTSKTYLISPDITLANSEIRKSDRVVSIFPNPSARGEIQVKIESEASSADFVIHDIHGKIYPCEVHLKGQGQWKLNTGGLSSGLYFLTINTEGRHSCHKIMMNQ
jgi:hypothetical protein